MDFDSEELIQKSIESINANLFVSQLRYTTSVGSQKDTMRHEDVKGGDSFNAAKTRTQTLRHAETSQIKYDLIGKIADPKTGTCLTRKTVAAILSGLSPERFAMFRHNPEEFITKVIKLIKEQKATVIVDHITYDQIEGEYDSSIFTAENAIFIKII